MTHQHRRCLRNFALVHDWLAQAGSTAVNDGCQIFVQDQQQGLLCQACGCHRNFHELVVDDGQPPAASAASAVVAVKAEKPTSYFKRQRVASSEDNVRPKRKKTVELQQAAAVPPSQPRSPATEAKPASNSWMKANDKEMLQSLDLLSRFLSKYPEHTKYANFQIKEAEDDEGETRRKSIDSNGVIKQQKVFKIHCHLCDAEVDMDKHLRSLRAHLGDLTHRIRVREKESLEPPRKAVPPPPPEPLANVVASSDARSSVVEDLEVMVIFESDLIGRTVKGIGELAFTHIVKLEKQYFSMRQLSERLVVKSGAECTSKVAQIFMMTRQADESQWRPCEFFEKTGMVEVDNSKVYFVRMCTSRLFGPHEHHGIRPPPLSTSTGETSSVVSRVRHSQPTVVLLVKLSFYESEEDSQSAPQPEGSIYVGSVQCDLSVRLKDIRDFLKIALKFDPEVEMSLFEEELDGSFKSLDMQLSITTGNIGSGAILVFRSPKASIRQSEDLRLATSIPETNGLSSFDESATPQADSGQQDVTMTNGDEDKPTEESS
jgi:hypothetical protein